MLAMKVIIFRFISKFRYPHFAQTAACKDGWLFVMSGFFTKESAICAEARLSPCIRRTRITRFIAPIATGQKSGIR